MMQSESSGGISSHEDAIVIFLHGSGDTGEGIKSWLADSQVWNGQFEAKLMEHGVRVVYPTAKTKYYSLWGSTGNVWFDRTELHPSAPEDLDGIEDSLVQIQAIVKDALSKGVSPQKIFLGGFSMGGCMAFHCMRYLQIEWAGIFTLSSFLNEVSGVLLGEDYEGEYTWPPVLMMHGNSDDLVPLNWGAETARRLKRMKVQVTWEEYKGLDHNIDSDEIRSLYHWIIKTLNSMDPPSGALSEEMKSLKIPGQEERKQAGLKQKSDDEEEEDEETNVTEKGIRYAVSMEGNQAIVTFQVPPGSEELLCATTMTARGSFFQLEKCDEMGKVKVSFYSPNADVTARAIADRISQRLADPNPPGAENCCLC